MIFRFGFARLLLILTASAVSTSGLPVRSFAEQAAGTALVDVGGTSITRAALDREMRVWADSTATRVNDKVARAGALERLIDRRLLSLAGREHNPARDDSVRAIEEMRAIWNGVRASTHSELSPGDLEEFRERRLQKVTPRQIITETKDEAVAAFDRVRAGEDFSAVAKEVSIDMGSAAAGGAVYGVRYGEWLPELIASLETIDEGDMVGPIHTRLGWHVIICDRLEYGDEARDLVTDDVLVDKLRVWEELVGVDAWAQEMQDTHGSRVHEAGIAEAVANIQPVPIRTKAPSWRADSPPSDAPIASTEDGRSLSVAEFAQFYPILGWIDYPRPRNPASIRTTALRVLALKVLRDDIREKNNPMDADVAADYNGQRDSSTGGAFVRALNAGIEVTPELADSVYSAEDEPFVTPEAVGLAALYVRDLAMADELYAGLESGVLTIQSAVEKAKETDPEAYHVPHMPFVPRGAFPDADKLVFELEEGEFAEPLPTADGFMIYQVVKKRPPRKLRRAEMTDETLHARVASFLGYRNLQRTLKDLREQFPVTRNESEVRRAIDSD